MIINLASGRGASRIVNQRNILLRNANTFQKALLEKGRARKLKRAHNRIKMLEMRHKKSQLARQYNSLAKEVEQIANRVLVVGDAVKETPKSEGETSKKDVLKALKEVETLSCVDLETRRLSTIIHNISRFCPEVSQETSRESIPELETAISILVNAREFLQIALEREKEIIANYERVEQYGEVVAELVEAYDALDGLEEWGQAQVLINVSGRNKPVTKEAIFRLFKQRMVGEIEDLTNENGEIYERRVHTITNGEWDDMIVAAASGVGAKTAAPSEEKMKLAFSEALLVRNAFVFAARELFKKLGGQTNVVEPKEGANVVPVDFSNGKRL